MTPYLVLNVHWARLLICPSERGATRGKREETRGEEKVQGKTAGDVRNDGGVKKRERTER